MNGFQVFLMNVHKTSSCIAGAYGICSSVLNHPPPPKTPQSLLAVVFLSQIVLDCRLLHRQ